MKMSNILFIQCWCKTGIHLFMQKNKKVSSSSSSCNILYSPSLDLLYRGALSFQKWWPCDAKKEMKDESNQRRENTRKEDEKPSWKHLSIPSHSHFQTTRVTSNNQIELHDPSWQLSIFSYFHHRHHHHPFFPSFFLLFLFLCLEYKYTRNRSVFFSLLLHLLLTFIHCMMAALFFSLQRTVCLVLTNKCSII